MSKIQKTVLVCPECSTKFERYPSQIRSTNNYCSKQCAYKNMPPCTNERKIKLSKLMSGAGNPAYGGGQWDDDRRARHSKTMKQAMKDPHRRYVSGNANRDKKFSKELIQRMHAHRTPSTYGHTPSEQRRKEIGKESSKRWADPDIKRRIVEGGRATKEAKGTIIPRSMISPWKIYWQQAGWKASYRYTQELNLQERGLCRDHIVGRKQGFLLGIFPEILRHPENCQVITLSENSSKARRKADPTQPDLLMSRIMEYKGDYPEHNLVVSRVIDYLEGKRYERSL